MTDYLTSEQILFLHARLIEETGGSHGLRDPALLLSAVARPRATFDSKDLYPDVFQKAAALMESLIRNHPFVDGNKRTGIAGAAIFLRRNRYSLTSTNRELEEFTLRVSRSEVDLTDIADWLKSNRIKV
ncbi:MAG: type II toxin-antitoxin system death-on-curing family toxin [Chloroflexota bacterium]|nr:type II toxin-antitoxin system death-on-curing family toxin [Chloroflexota bacterium]